MQETKYLIGIIAVILTFVGYVPYLRDTINGKTKPHVYSWFLWGFVTLIAFALQVSAGAGAGSLVTLAAAIVSLVIFALGMRQGKKTLRGQIQTFLYWHLLLWRYGFLRNSPLFQ